MLSNTAMRNPLDSTSSPQVFAKRLSVQHSSAIPSIFLKLKWPESKSDFKSSGFLGIEIGFDWVCFFVL